MSASSIEREVQDYLDERLTPHERIAFEERMRVDPRLSLRVQAERELGTLLREDPGGLSAGFYARARRRFEESAAEGRRSFRLVSWEAAGLAAAAALVMALFVPQFVREGAPEPGRPASAPQTPPGEFSDDAPSSEPVHPPMPRPQAPSAMQAKPVRPREEDAYAAVPPKARHDEAEPEITAPLSTLRERESVASDHAYAPAPQAGAVEQAVPKNPAAMQERALGKSSAESLRAATAHRAPVAPTAVSLPPGVIAPGAVRVVEEPQTWEALLRGEAGPALAALGPADTERRLVLIGVRQDLNDCSALVLVETAQAWELHYPLAERDTGGHASPASGGCAFVLPRDHKVVRIAGPG